MKFLQFKNNKNLFVYGAATAVNLMSMAVGIAYAWSSPSVPKLNGNVDPGFNPLPKPTTIIQDSWITSLQSLGALCGLLFSGICSVQFGRKKTLLAFSLPVLASNVAMIFASDVKHFYAARFLAGLGTGCTYAVIPLYVAEISEVAVRGFTSMFLGIMIAFVQVLVYVAGPYISIRTLGVISLVPSVLFLVTFGFLVPESPYYFVMAGRQAEAEVSLAKLRRKAVGDVHKELLDIIKSVDESKTKDSSIGVLVKNKVVRKTLFLAVGLMFFQQYTGILALVPYCQTIFDLTKTPIPGDISVMLVGLVQFITAVITSNIIDRIDRRKLLLLSLFSIFVSLICLGSFFYLQAHNYNVDGIFWLPIASMIVYICGFNVGIGPIPWTIMGEIFPPNLKSYLSSIATFFNIIQGFLISMFFPSVYEAIGMAWTIWFFAFCTALSLAFIIFVLPETRGKTFLEIQVMLRG